MEIKIIIVLGIVNFLDGLFQKWNIWNWLSKIGSETSSRFIYDLTTCKICLTFHLSILVTLLMGASCGFEWGLFTVPFVVVGLTTLLKK